MFKRTIVLFLTVGGLMVTECFGDAASLFKQGVNCKEKGYYKQAEETYKSVIANYPGTPQARKSQEQLAVIYILTQRITQAQASIGALKTAFSGDAELAGSLYWIARNYRLEGHPQRAVNLYQEIMSQYPDSSYAKKAQLDIPRTNIFSLLGAGKYTEAEAAIDKLLNDFSGHPELAETLYDIARECKHKARYGKAKSLYQYILQRYPATSYGEMCPIQVPKMDIWAKIASGDFAGAQAAQ